MHSSNDAACKEASLQPSHRANQFSFPPTQRFGLLDSTSLRSTDQHENLHCAFEGLLEALHTSQLQNSPA